VIGEIEALLDKRIDVGGSLLAASLARMQQHVFDDGVSALSVLDDLSRLPFSKPVNSSTSPGPCRPSRLA
jgi:hypothetical protein